MWHTDWTQLIVCNCLAQKRDMVIYHDLLFICFFALHCSALLDRHSGGSEGKRSEADRKPASLQLLVFAHLSAAWSSVFATVYSSQTIVYFYICGLSHGWNTPLRICTQYTRQLLSAKRVQFNFRRVTGNAAL